MKPLDYPLLLDENIHPDIARMMRNQGHDVVTVADLGATGVCDAEVLRHAFLGGRVVLTQDSDFGTLAVRSGHGMVGIIYLRPGHIRAEVVWSTLEVVRAIETAPQPPFILVAERREGSVRIRVRELQTLG